MWGIVVAFASRVLPPDTEARLGAFTELIATAISNVQARDDLRLLADEQGALRRVATQVARGVSAAELFGAVAEEACQLIGAADTRVARYEGNREITVLSGHGNLSDDPPAGTRLPLDGPSVTATVLRTGRPMRIDNGPEGSGTLASLARDQEVSCTVAAPIVVDGSLWGLVVSSWHGNEHPAPGVEEQLAAFTPLIATAISNVQARDGLRHLAEEQGALRRVATLVAQGAPPSAIFGAVASEASRLLGIERIDINRYRSDGRVVVLGSAGEVPVPFGEPWQPEPPSVAATVRDTGRAARIDDFSNLPGLSAETARAVGISSVAGVPILVDGAIWGVMMALAPERLPEYTERRLTDFTDLVASAISQAQARDDLITSRARIVTASDETRRRIERNLHDGVQQRMLALGLSLRAVRASIPDSETDARRGLDRVDGELERLLEEIRDISRGLHPALLSRAGLGPSLRILARRSPIPVSLHVNADPRPPEAIEVAIYYILSEALSNAAKHSSASEISVTVGVQNNMARTIVCDNGVGGAVPGAGSGLIGLIDRAEALGGRLVLESPPSGGTTISVELPLPGASSTPPAGA